jgi:hypothetical protein
MKLCRICLVGMGFLLLLVSCSESEISRDDTEDFIGGLQTMFLSAGTSESSLVLRNFGESNPPGPNLSSGTSLEDTRENLRALRGPAGLDTIYGTWDYQDLQGWKHVDTNNPANAILFTWDYYDSLNNSHPAELLIDSLEFYADTMPTKVWIGLNVDESDIAWLKLGAHYLSADETDSVSLVYRIINLFEMGISITTIVDVADVEFDSTFLDSTDFVGTIHLWTENLVTEYRVDFSVTRYVNDSGRLTLGDSRGWDMVFNVSEDVSTNPAYERRDVDGEITKHGDHAASIEGVIWDPEDDEHITEVVIIFSDDTDGDYTYLGELFFGFFE